MLKFASQEIDFHDNHGLLAQVEEDLPDFVKKAAPAKVGDVPMDRWAVVLVTPEKTFSKFALHNKAYVWVSSRLFPKTARHLPTRARQVAAHHIKEACLEYRIPYPAVIDREADAIEKISSNVLEMSANSEDSALDYDKYRLGWKGELPKELLMEQLEHYAHRDRPDGVDAQELGEEMASRIYSYAMREGYSLPSADSLAGMASRAMPEGFPKDKARGFFKDRIETLEAAEKVKHASNQARRIGYIEEAFGVVTKTASGETVGRFQMNTPELVKKAQDYFLDQYSLMHPKYRRELAQNIVKQASEHGVYVEDERIRSYCGEGFSESVDGNVLARLPLLKGAEEDIEGAEHTLKNLLVLRQKGEIEAEKFASVLESFDKRCGLDSAWDSHIKDPWLSTYEYTKQASWTFTMGNDTITEEQLRRFMRDHSGELRGYLQQHLVAELQRNPTIIFDSLPRPEKEILLYKMQEAGVAG
jgi:hypothetical protein